MNCSVAWKCQQSRWGVQSGAANASEKAKLREPSVPDLFTSVENTHHFSDCFKPGSLIVSSGGKRLINCFPLTFLPKKQNKTMNKQCTCVFNVLGENDISQASWGRESIQMLMKANEPLMMKSFRGCRCWRDDSRFIYDKFPICAEFLQIGNHLREALAS